MRSIDEVDPKDKRVLVRVDWNVTLGKALQLVDDTRIMRTKKTIEYLLTKSARQIVLCAHLGKPGGKVVPELSLAPVVKYAEKLIGEPISLVSQFSSVSASQSRVVMLENLRFWEGENANDEEFSQELAGLAEVYVNEAFGVSHRAVASVVGVAKLLPSYAGFDLIEEVERISKAVESPARPLVVVMGGSKVEDKLKLLDVISRKADTLLLGGKLANEYQKRKIELSGKARVIIPVEGDELLDIGEGTSKIFAEEISKAQTVIWNGPMGKVEDEQYRAGTHKLYEALIENEPADVIVGGGDTLAAISDEAHLERIDYVSTGGGAMLKLIENGTLVGLEVLKIT